MEGRFHYAIMKNDTNSMIALIEQGVNINDKHNGIPPLSTALLSDRIDAAILLINQPNIDLNGRTPAGSTPLHIVAESDDVQIAQLLINRGADIDAFDQNDNTPLHLAALYDNRDMVELLLNNGANKSLENLDSRFPFEMTEDKELSDYIRYYDGLPDVKEPDSDY